jgi:hypothetical protein
MFALPMQTTVVERRFARTKSACAS